MTETECECGRSKDPRARSCKGCYRSRGDIPEKLCTQCLIIYLIEDFAWRPDGRGGRKRRSACRSCESAYARQRRQANPQRHNEIKRRSMDKIKASKTPEQRRRDGIRQSAKNLGFDPDVITAHFDQHSGQCDICGQACGTFARLTIDHDHATGDFRGLLCVNCNHLLGKARDQVDILKRAIEYLGRGPICAKRF